MSIDLIGALKAPWRKDCGFARLFLGGLCMLIPFLAFVPIGYIAEYLNKLINGKDELGNIFQHGSKSFVIGGKLFIGFLLLNIPYFLMYLILAMCLSENHPFAYMGLSSLISIIWSLIAMLMLLCFGIDLKILSAVDFERAINIVKEAPSKVFIMLLLSFIVSIIYSFATIIPYIACFLFAGIFAAIGLAPLSIILVIIGIIILLTIGFAMSIAMYNIMGQYARESQYIQSIKKELA